MDFFRSINSGRFLAIESNDKPANTIIKSPHVLAYQFNWDWTQLVPRCNIKKVEVEVSAWSPGEKNQETKGNHLTLVLQVEECPCAEVRITAVPDPSRSPLVELEDGVVGWKGHVKIMFSKHEGANEMYTPDRPVFKKISLPMPARRASQSLAPTTTTTTTSYRPPPPPQPTMTAATATTTTTTTPTPAVRGVGCSYHPARYSGGIETDRKGFPLSTVIDLIISCGLDQYEFYEDVTNNRSWMWALNLGCTIQTLMNPLEVTLGEPFDRHPHEICHGGVQPPSQVPASSRRSTPSIKSSQDLLQDLLTFTISPTRSPYSADSSTRQTGNSTQRAEEPLLRSAARVSSSLSLLEKMSELMLARRERFAEAIRETIDPKPRGQNSAMA
ncbi:hypothetical protein V8F33_007248 [Rhypophila sp. PSN 637]